MVVAGDVTADEVKADAEETYGKVAGARRADPRQRPMEPAQEAPRTVTLADSRVEQPSVSRNYLVPSDTTAKPGESEALEVLPMCSAAARIAGCTAPWWSTRASRSAPAPIIPAPRSITPSSAFTARRSRAYSAQLEDGIDAVLDDVIQHGITADELDRAKNRLIADAVYAQDNQATLARWYGAALATGQTVDMVRGWPDRIAP